MALPTNSKNLVTVERLSAVIGGSDGTGGLWGKIKSSFPEKSDVVSNVTYDKNTGTLKKTINGTTTDVVQTNRVVTLEYGNTTYSASELFTLATNAYTEIVVNNGGTICHLVSRSGSSQVGWCTLNFASADTRFGMDINEVILDITSDLDLGIKYTWSEQTITLKTSQGAKTDPTASGTTLTAIATISQNEQGVITATKKTIQDGTTSQKGVVQLSTATNSTSTSLAATASAVKSAYDLANGKQDPITFDGTYSATTNKAATVSTVTNAIAALDVSAIAGAASKTLTSISETDGKISATYSNIAIAESQVTNLTTDLNAKAPLASPALTGTPTAPTADAGTNTTQIATTAFVKTEIDNVLDAADAMQFKGTIGSSGATVTTLPATHKAGWTYKVATAGTYAGKACEIGDMIICVKDGTTAADADWTVVQNNIDGAVTGPTSSVDARVAVFNGTTGKVIKDSGFTIGKSVPSDAKFTDASVTAASNHYTPSTASGSDKSASASGATAAWGIDVVKGVTLNTDGKGHVTGISVTSGKIPTNPNTDTKVTQTLVASDNTSEYPILLAPTGQTATATTTSNFVTGAKYKPSTNTLSVNISGNAATATSATTAANYATGGTIESALAGKAASNHTHTASLAADSSSGTVVSLSANTQYKLTAGGSSVLFKTPANPTVNNGALKIQLNGGTATSKFTANASSDATLTFATGSSNGTIAVDGTDVAVKGLGTAAYTASTAYATSTHTHSVTINGVAKTIPASGGTAVDLGTYLTSHQSNANLGTGYGTCATAEGTAAKAVTLSNYVLATGGYVSVKFTNAVPASATMDINSKGAKNIYYRGSAITAGVIGAGDTATFIYDGTQYQLLSVDSGEQEMTPTEVDDLLAALT